MFKTVGKVIDFSYRRYIILGIIRVLFGYYSGIIRVRLFRESEINLNFNKFHRAPTAGVDKNILNFNKFHRFGSRQEFGTLKIKKV